MSRAFAVPFLGTALISGTFLAAWPQTPEPDESASLYAQLCANCHGASLEGGQAPSLLDNVWTFGGDDGSVMASIREGRLEAGMPAFGELLTERQIRALLIFIREQEHRARTAGTVFARPIPDTVVRSEHHAFKLEVVAEGLETPWGLAFLPDGSMLVTERPGRLRVIENGRLLPKAISGIPVVWEKQDGGLLDLALHPDYPRNGWIYLGYSDPGPDATSQTAIVRGRIRDGWWVDQQVIHRPSADLYRRDNSHFGLRFLFDDRGHLFYSIGDRGEPLDSQDLSNPNGKIHRVLDDGRVPADNPFAGRRGVEASIWSYGHRNPQGLAWHPVTGELWSSEHGPRGGDELNVIGPGRNYGWPIITYGMNHDGTAISDLTEKEGMEQPVLHWTPSIAVCAIAFYTGDKFPAWKHDLFVTALAHEELRRLVVDGRRVVHQELLFKGIGRVRDVKTGPDGYLYVALNNPGRIVRLVP